MRTVRPFEDNERDKAKNWDSLAEMWVKSHVDMVEQYFTSVETPFSKQGVPDKKKLPNTHQMRNLQNKWNRNLDQKIGIFNFDHLEVAANQGMSAIMAVQSTQKEPMEYFAIDDSRVGKLPSGYVARSMNMDKDSYPRISNCLESTCFC